MMTGRPHQVYVNLQLPSTDWSVECMCKSTIRGLHNTQISENIIALQPLYMRPLSVSCACSVRAGAADGAPQPDVAGDSGAGDRAGGHPEADRGDAQRAEYPVHQRLRRLLPRPALPLPDHPHLPRHAQYVPVRRTPGNYCLSVLTCKTIRLRIWGLKGLPLGSTGAKIIPCLLSIGTVQRGNEHGRQHSSCSGL